MRFGATKEMEGPCEVAPASAPSSLVVVQLSVFLFVCVGVGVLVLVRARLCDNEQQE